MGRLIERIARERGHEIVAVIDVNNTEDFGSPAFRSADVAIEFTAPQVALGNYRRAWAAGVPVVSGTTGWTAQLDQVKREVAEGGHTLFWSSNFSLGVNLFMMLSKYLAGLMNRYPQYDVTMTEVHHTHKLDAPSGTAITLAEGILEKLDRKTRWVKEQAAAPDELPIRSIPCATSRRWTASPSRTMPRAARASRSARWWRRSSPLARRDFWAWRT